MIEKLILAAILLEITMSVIFYLTDRKSQKEISGQLIKILGEQKDVLEESGAELADINEALSEEEIGATE